MTDDLVARVQREAFDKGAFDFAHWLVDGDYVDDTVRRYLEERADTLGSQEGYVRSQIENITIDLSILIAQCDHDSGYCETLAGTKLVADEAAASIGEVSRTLDRAAAALRRLQAVEALPKPKVEGDGWIADRILSLEAENSRLEAEIHRMRYHREATP
jgi:hypothetical protein